MVGTGEVFLAAKNVGLNLRAGKTLTNLVNHFAKQFAFDLARIFQCFAQYARAPRVNLLKA